MRIVSFFALCLFVFSFVTGCATETGTAGLTSAPSAAPAPQAIPAPTPQEAPRAQAPVAAQAAPQSQTTAQAPATQTGQSDKIQKELDTYAAWYVDTMNREITPNMKKKQVSPHPDGFVAKYMLIDPSSLRTSYTASENKSVSYIGRVMFHKVEYICIGKTKEQAMAGPFIESNRQPVTELILYMKGKWTYRY